VASGALHPTSLDELKALFGGAIRRFRRAKSLTQKELGEIAKISRSQVSAYERGKQWAMAKNLARMLNALEVTATDFLAAVQAGARSSPGATDAAASIAEIDRPDDLEVTDLARRGWSEDFVQIQIKELSLVIPADRLSIGPPSPQPRTRSRSEP